MALPKLIDLAPRITFLRGDVNYTQIHFVDAPVLLICKTLKECTAELPHFLRVHKQYTINPAYLRAVSINEQDRASLLVSNQLIPVSRRRHKDVLIRLWPRLAALWLTETAPLEKLAAHQPYSTYPDAGEELLVDKDTNWALYKTAVDQYLAARWALDQNRK